METRRHILKAGLAGAAASALPWRAAAQESAPLGVAMLSPHMALVTGAGGNVLAVSDGVSVTMVDSGQPGRTADILNVIAGAFPRQPVTTAINTHWHHAQTGGNAALARAGATLVAHANTRLWLTTDVTYPYDGVDSAPTQPMPPEAWPIETFFYDPQTRGQGAARAEYGLMLQAHTDGDLYVFFPEANVLHCGGALSSNSWSNIDWWTGGWMGGVVEAAETLLQIANDETRIVGSDGEVFDKAELQVQRDMYADLFVHFRDNLLFKGLSPAEAVAERPLAAYKPHWADPDAFVVRAFQSLWHYFAPEV